VLRGDREAGFVPIRPGVATRLDKPVSGFLTVPLIDRNGPRAERFGAGKIRALLKERGKS
jgi:hypothetical protein